MIQILVAPHSFEAFNRVDFLFGATDLHHEVRVADIHFLEEFSCFAGVLDEAKDSFSVILGNILGIVPETGIVTDFIFRNVLFFVLVVEFINFLRFGLRTLILDLGRAGKGVNIKRGFEIEHLIKKNSIERKLRHQLTQKLITDLSQLAHGAW